MFRFRWLPVLLMTGALATGCESLPDGKLAELAFGSGNKSQELEEEHRQRYQKSRDAVERDWLLGHAVESGMTPTEITRILGQDGERVVDDGWIKNHGGNYQMDDEAWKWGPDRTGQSVILVFRAGKLVNFNPSEFRTQG